MSGLSLAVADLSLAFAGRRVVDVSALAATPGSLTVLSGPSGSGKSTLLHLLCGLLVADTGAIRWAATNIAGLNEGRRDAWRRTHAGIVFQDFHLIEEMSPLANVLVPAWLRGYSAARWREPAGRLLETLGVPLARGRAALLSRGEQQRVAIARALVTDPPVVFADEPTASLDADAGGTVAGILAGLAHREGRTVIATTHDPALIERADIVLRLDRGQLVATDEAGPN